VNEKYKVLIGKNEIIKDYLPNALSKNNKILIISDKNIPASYIELVRKSIPSSKVIDVLKIKPGEQSKSFSNFQMILNKLAKKKYDRSDCIVAIGGGVVGDLSGFVAASYMRGIDYIQIPTSLLAQVDSSVGGKTAINIESGKNLVGAFKNPKLVLISSALLKTLPEREFKSGIAEIIKYGLIYNKKIFNIFDKQHKLNSEKEPKTELKNLYMSQVKTKAKIVTEDERELGIRAILNFGHTYGHAIEAKNNYKNILHGEAVAMGMRMASKMSMLEGHLSEKAYKKIINVFDALGFPKNTSGNYSDLKKFIMNDKKVKGRKH
jgi:3-dehydroquinate synthase